MEFKPSMLAVLEPSMIVMGVHVTWPTCKCTTSSSPSVIVAIAVASNGAVNARNTRSSFPGMDTHRRSMLTCPLSLAPPSSNVTEGAWVDEMSMAKSSPGSDLGTASGDSTLRAVAASSEKPALLGKSLGLTVSFRKPWPCSNEKAEFSGSVPSSKATALPLASQELGGAWCNFGAGPVWYALALVSKIAPRTPTVRYSDPMVMKHKDMSAASATPLSSLSGKGICMLMSERKSSN
mmetsp:Transcript_119783/g.335438  ORF Transcript_119783/g.335438 Transcript_119783/m.335438 type:complete len:236 (-) Transcript_119783:814-1521(-)